MEHRVVAVDLGLDPDNAGVAEHQLQLPKEQRGIGRAIGILLAQGRCFQITAY